jgi:hypothetical protein
VTEEARSQPGGWQGQTEIALPRVNKVCVPVYLQFSGMCRQSTGRKQSIMRVYPGRQLIANRSHFKKRKKVRYNGGIHAGSGESKRERSREGNKARERRSILSTGIKWQTEEPKAGKWGSVAGSHARCRTKMAGC